MAHPALLWFVGYSNITSVVIVTLCFLAMTVFICFVSMNADYLSRPSVHLGVEQKRMVQLSNPFVLQLRESSKTLADGVHLNLSSLSPSQVFVLWGVKIDPMHDLILKPGIWLRQALLTGQEDVLRQLDSLHCDQIFFTAPGNHGFSLCCPASVSSAALGDMPRQRYPVSVFIFVPDHEASFQDGQSCADPGASFCDSHTEDSIIGLISVVHLKDEKVKVNSHIISQYVKTSGVPLFSLQPLYLNSSSLPEDVASAEPRRAARSVTVGNDQTSSGATAQSHIQAEPDAADICGCGTQQIPSSSGYHRDFTASASLSKSQFIHPKLKSEGGSVNNLCDENEELCDETVSSDGRSTATLNTLPLSEISVSSQKSGSGLLHVDGLQEGQDAATCSCRLCHRGSGGTHNQAECVVCQTHQVRCVLLPCRHACICLGCFKLLTRCPMCRAAIESYFLLSQGHAGGVSDSVSSDDEGEDGVDHFLTSLQQQAVNTRFHQVWQQIHLTLNNFFGLRQGQPIN